MGFFFMHTLCSVIVINKIRIVHSIVLKATGVSAVQAGCEGLQSWPHVPVGSSKP